jgi:hypothetical protein
VRRAVLVLAAFALASLALVARADAFVYWANFNTGTIGRANLDGSGADQRFIGGASGPVGLAVDGAHVYWANFNISRIGRADLDGSGADQSFITGSSQVRGVAVDGANIYWTSPFVSAIGRADLDRSNVNQEFITGTGGATDVAVDGAHVYWANNLTNTIGRANLDGTGVDQRIISGASGPAGIAVDGPTIAELIGEVEELGLPHGIARSLLAKLGGAQRRLDAGNLAAACDKLGAFANEVRAQTGKRIDAAEAAELVSQVSAVRASLGCGPRAGLRR